ncbi:MAG: hypothetical protein ACKOXI_06805, partial [Candidatus Planktophila sp.]
PSIGELVQNRVLSYYEELLTLGSHLRETEREALYKYLLISKRNEYFPDAKELLRIGKLDREIANGQISYSLRNGALSYSARKKGAAGYLENFRELKLHGIYRFRMGKIIKFFAQSEVDVIWNYPVLTNDPEEEGSFSIISIPYFDLRYFSKGEGKILGLINKMKFEETEILQQLRAS